jgi:hypothetical protein
LNVNLQIASQNVDSFGGNQLCFSLGILRILEMDLDAKSKAAGAGRKINIIPIYPKEQ